MYMKIYDSWVPSIITERKYRYVNIGVYKKAKKKKIIIIKEIIKQVLLRKKEKRIF